MNRISGIYIIYINNKPYVGSAVDLNRRSREHKTLLKSNRHYNTHLQNAWNKYGNGKFIFKVIEKCSIEKLIEREQHWINYYDAANPDKGYNICKVAYSTIGQPAWNKGIPMSDSLKQTLIKFHTGRKHTVEELEKMRLANLGKTYSERKGAKILISKICLVCKTEFKRVPYIAKQRKYCSTKCSNVGRKGQKLGPFTAEHKNRISLSKIGKSIGPFTEDHKQKLSISNLGKNTGKSRLHSEETKKLLKQNAKLRFRNCFGKFIQGDNYEN